MPRSPEEISRLVELSRRLRGDILRMLTEAGSGHPGGSLSAIDILACLFFAKMRRPGPDGAAHADRVIDDPRFWRAPCVGHKGWVSMDARQIQDWEEVRALVLESYGLIAPKRSLARLDARGATPRRPKRSASLERLRARA